MDPLIAFLCLWGAYDLLRRLLNWVDPIEPGHDHMAAHRRRTQALDRTCQRSQIARTDPPRCVPPAGFQG